jgi:hypothetical protein
MGTEQLRRVERKIQGSYRNGIHKEEKNVFRKAAYRCVETAQQHLPEKTKKKKPTDTAAAACDSCGKRGRIRHSPACMEQ